MEKLLENNWKSKSRRTAPCASSSRRIPKDQTSARSSYPTSSSGATTCEARKMM